jgi:hypothetical protein
MINAYKKFKNKKFKKINRRDPSCGHLLLILRSKLSLKFSIKIFFFLKLSRNSFLLLYLFFQKYIFSYFRVYFLKIFFYIHTGEIFMYIILKNQCCSFILSMLFFEIRHTFFRAPYFLRWHWYDTAEKWLTDDFSQNIFPITPPETC